MPLYALAALLLMWLYSYAPVRLSYRGGGELVDRPLGAGTRVVLMLVHRVAGQAAHLGSIVVVQLHVLVAAGAGHGGGEKSAGGDVDLLIDRVHPKQLAVSLLTDVGQADIGLARRRANDFGSLDSGTKPSPTSLCKTG